MSAVSSSAVPRARVGLHTEVASLAVTVAGTFLLTVGGVIHFDLGDVLLHRAPAYLVALFFLNAVGTLVAVAGIALRIRGAWTLGALVAVPSIVLLLLAGTSGLPRVHLPSLTSGTELLCLGTEVLYTLLWLRLVRRDLFGSVR
jgi:hypothetical protein